MTIVVNGIPWWSMVNQGWPWLTMVHQGWTSLDKVYHDFLSFRMVDYGWPLSSMVDNHWVWFTMISKGWLVHHGFQRLTSSPWFPKVDYAWNMDKWLLLVQVAWWHPIMWLCGITTLFTVHVALWHPTMVLSQCDVHHHVPRENVFVTLQHSWKSRLKSDNHLYVCHIVMLNKNYARFWCYLVGLSH